MKCCCCLADKKDLFIKTSDTDILGLPLYLHFWTDKRTPRLKFSAELPNQVKNYIFAPLNGIADNAQLLSHLMEDGIAQKMVAQFKMSTDEAMDFSMDEKNPIFEVNYGKKGFGKYTEVKFFPSYISMQYGNNAKCCFGKLLNPCKIQSHETVRTC